MKKTSKPNCVYCTLPVIKKREICGTALAWAFPTNIPITLGHTLIAPRACKSRFSDLTTEEQIEIFGLAEKVMDGLKKIHMAEGFNICWNEGKLSGQNVPHFHLHIVPRKEGDIGLLGYDPRSMLYRTGDREPTPEDKLLKIRDKIKKAVR